MSMPSIVHRQIVTSATVAVIKVGVPAQRSFVGSQPRSNRRFGETSYDRDQSDANRTGLFGFGTEQGISSFERVPYVGFFARVLEV